MQLVDWTHEPDSTIAAVDIQRWTRSDLDARLAGALLDELDGVAVVVLDGATIEDEGALATWWDRAPCVVVARTPAHCRPPESVDVAITGGNDDDLEQLLERIASQPVAAHTLVDVLRVLRGLDVASGLVVESLAYSMLLASEGFRGWLATQPVRPLRHWTGPAVRTARYGARLHLTLDRSGNRNAFSADLRDSLLEALEPAEVDPSIAAIVVDAAGPVFSSGGDLAEFGTSSDVARAHEIRTLRSVGAAIDRLRDRVTVHVQGRCVGAGVELAAFAGRVVADPETTFRLPELAMGLIPGAGGTVSLSRRIGRQATAYLALSGAELPASAAFGLGLVDEVRPVKSDR